jgi:superfamily II DNA/RNA helicase
MTFDIISHYHNGNLFLGLNDYGFEKMAEIQEMVLPDMLNGNDLIVQSKSGTGKSSLFCIGSLAMIDPTKKYPQIVIIVNTKELAQQIQHIIMLIGKHINFKSSLCIGGQYSNSSENKNKKNYNKECYNVNNNIKEALTSHILIGTPGRICDIFQRESGLYENIKSVIIDEADVLLDGSHHKKELSFKHQLTSILGIIHHKIQLCIFSVTFNNITELEQIMNNPKKILINNDNINVDLIKNYYIELNSYKEKNAKLEEIFTNTIICQSVIFVNTIDSLEYIQKFFNKIKYNYDVLHSRLSDIDRINILSDFRNGKIRILIATDIISRGIDIQKVGLIINYDIPQDPDTYIHRIGRSGRYGRKGIAINLLTNREYDYFTNINDKYKLTLTELSSWSEIENYYD